MFVMLRFILKKEGDKKFASVRKIRFDRYFFK